jgi:SagB-type dehydrogenase family enzyme
VILLSLRPGLRLSRDGQASLTVAIQDRSLRLSGLDSDVLQLLLRLADSPVAWPTRGSGAGTPNPSWPGPDGALMQLAERRLIRFTCTAGPHELMAALPTGGPCSAAFDLLPEDQPFRLSRFTYLRNLRGELVIESPQRFLRVHIVAPEVTSLLAGLARGESVASLCEQNPACGKEATREAVRFLAGVGAIGAVSGQGRLAEDVDADLAPLEFHDVVFHCKTRRGLTDAVAGATFPFLGVIPPAPAVKPAMSASLIRLTVPDLGDLLRNDPPLARIMEDRRSLRRYGNDVTLDQVGEFLYRTARVRSVLPAEPGAGRPYDATNRTYPSGGATYDLELYLTFRRCAGISPGVYHYEPAEHALSLVCSRPALVSAMLENARSASGQEEPPPVLITFSTRFSRLSWKYRSISYATTLKNVGVLYEAMYLAATAMGLAPCALGGGDSALFSRVTGLHPLIESSVGEFMLGMRSPLDGSNGSHGHHSENDFSADTR